ncbi:MAG: YihY/virulence factor BrkB family protein [Lachnospiraceae bacterium]|nr:YihY/virulence factor BrkB family protein [Lachnospiraceae bacterium]
MNKPKYLKETIQKVKNDHITAFASQGAFFIILSFFPFVMFLMTLIRVLPVEQADITKYIIALAPENLNEYIINIINELYTKASSTVVSISVVAAIWSAGRAVMAISKGLNKVYEVNESRNYLLTRIVSSVYTLIFALGLILSLLILVFGNKLYHMLGSKAGFLVWLVDFILSFRNVFGLVFFTILFLLIYCAIPNRKSKIRNELPGAFLAAVSWIAISYAFSIYVDKISDFSYMYGSLAGIVIAMLWLYFCMIMVFIGAEFNYALDKYVMASEKEDL